MGVIVVLIITVLTSMLYFENRESAEDEEQKCLYSVLLFVTSINNTYVNNTYEGQIVEGVCLDEGVEFSEVYHCKFYFTNQKLEELQTVIRMSGRYRLFFGRDKYGGITVQKVKDHP